ncbi:MAG TPA: hypothetical protein VK162_17940, partial [Streptosporangiaceae bacterium]|nr:hypothetical protein [Streptosporangiaceae bacterium]
ISRQLVAYDTGCASENSDANGEYSVCQMMRVFDLVTGKLRSFAAPPGWRVGTGPTGRTAGLSAR